MCALGPGSPLVETAKHLQVFARTTTSSRWIAASMQILGPGTWPWSTTAVPMAIPWASTTTESRDRRSLLARECGKRMGNGWETDGKRMGNIGTLLGLRCQVHGFAGKLRKSNGWSAFCFFGYNSFPIRFFWIGTSHHFWSNLPCGTACCTRACCQGICLDAMAQCCEYVVQRL